MKQLHEAQKTATKELAAVFKKSARAKAIMMCGTGKTLVGVHAAAKARRVVVFVPNLGLTSQTLATWRKELPDAEPLAVCSLSESSSACEVTRDSARVRSHLSAKGSRVVFCTYQSAKILAGLTFDLGIFDEAHRTAGAADKEFGFALHDKNIKIKKRLFLTATERVVRPSKGGEAVSSMDDEAVYGPKAYELPYDKALEARNTNGNPLIVPYRIIIPVLNGEGAGIEDVGRINALRAALRQAMHDRGCKRALAYTNRVADAKAFATGGRIGAEGKQGALAVYHVNGKMKSDEQELELTTFESNDGPAVITNSKCFIEGIDMPEADLVMFVDPRSGQIDIVQIVGRVIRWAPGKECGYVLLPVFRETDESTGAALRRTSFEDVCALLQALSDIDFKLKESIARARAAILDAQEKGEEPPAIELPGVEFVGADSAALVEFQRRVLIEVLGSVGPSRVEAAKERLREMARRGDRRPPAVGSDAGRVLCLLSSKAPWGDPLFIKEIQTLCGNNVVHWFPKIRRARAKESILEIAERRGSRPASKSYEGQVLGDLVKSSDPADVAYVSKVSALMPDWFNESRVESLKERIRDLARRNQPRPQKTTPEGRTLNQLTSRGRRHDDLFYVEMCEMAPDWFNGPRIERAKEKILDLAKKGKRRPTRHTYEGRLLGQLSSNPRRLDTEYIAKVKEVAPVSWWLPCLSG